MLQRALIFEMFQIVEQDNVLFLLEQSSLPFVFIKETWNTIFYGAAISKVKYLPSLV